MPFFEVNLERQQQATIYVEADSPDDALDAAENLVEERDWEDISSNYDLDADALPAEPLDQRYWTGGDSGRWVEPPTAARGGE